MKLLGEAGVCAGNMNWIEGADRQQTHLLPAAVEDYVGPDNPVRFMTHAEYSKDRWQETL